MLRALASRQCPPGLNPGVDVICGLSLMLVLSLASVFPSPQEPKHLQIPVRPGIRWTKNHYVDVLSLHRYLFIYLFIYISPAWVLHR